MTGLLEHVEILSQKISELEFPLNLTLSSADDAQQSLFVIQELQEKVQKYQSVAYTLNKELRKYSGLKF